MIYYVDIDNTICSTTGSDYINSMPIFDRIRKINLLYDHGHSIIYWTARGAVSGKDWFNFTKNQLNSWGCKFDQLRCDKPNYDIFIEDKSNTPEKFFDD